MDVILEFIKSDIGVAIAWFCTVGSVLYSLLKRRESKLLKIKVENLKNVISINTSRDDVVLNSEKIIYTKNNAGGMDIKM